MGLERCAEVSRILAEAFAEDPLQAWITQGTESSEGAAARVGWWSFMLRHGPAGAEVHMLGDGSGAACWHPAPAQRPSAEVAAAFRKLVGATAGERTPEVLEGLGRIAARAPAEAHWHLAAVGVAPARRGEGLGGRLLTPMLARCDRLGLPAYLESSNPANLGLYRRLGFSPTGELTLGDGQVTLTFMWRPPGGAHRGVDAGSS